MQIGSYQVLFELGQGGMGTVYLGRVRGTGDFERLVAIKRQRSPRKGFDEPAERFLTEARLAGLVHHANVVGIHQAGIDDEGYYFICDYVEGQSLGGLITHSRDDALWPVPIVTRVMLDALAGLQAAHEATDADGHALGMLHRDVAIDNLLVGRDGVTRLSDFGIAKSSRNRLLTEVGQIRGKLPYLAPEYLRAEAVDRTFDLYAAGITLWVALSGELPWGDLSEIHMMQAIRERGVPPLPQRERSFAPALEAVIARACHQDPRARFQSAREMLHALEAAVSSSGVIASHVQVAEHVERVAGAELAARRARIHARRRELDNTPEVVVSAGPTVAARRPHLSEPVASAAANAVTSNQTDDIRLPVSSALPRLTFVGVLLCLMLGAYLLWRPHAPEAPRVVPVPRGDSARRELDQQPDAALPTLQGAESEPPAEGRATAPARAGRTPSDAPQSVERARARKRSAKPAPEISTRNPYRSRVD